MAGFLSAQELEIDDAPGHFPHVFLHILSQTGLPHLSRFVMQIIELESAQTFGLLALLLLLILFA